MQQSSISQDWSDYNEPTQSNILIPGLIASPCKHHPSFDGPCPRIFKPKDHPACNNCGPRKVGYADRWNPIGYKEPAPQKPSESQVRLSKTMKEVLGSAKRKTKNCAWPGCTAQVKSGYCSKKGTPQHGQIINGRKFRYKRSHGGAEPPKEWLLRPIEKLCREKTSEVVKAMGFKSLFDAVYNLYFIEKMTLRGLGKKIGISGVTASSILREAGFEIKKNGGFSR